MNEVVVISRRYRGPPDSANGGYACGILAKRVQGDARVRLMVPPPLDVPMSIRESSVGQFELTNDAQLVAAGTAADCNAQIPDAVSYDVAARAAGNFSWHREHPFPTCFVCGPQRQHGDGLCIFPGRVADHQVVAAPWIPDASVCDDAGRVHFECPSWFGLLEFEPDATFGLLGQLTARVARSPRMDERCVVIGWSRGRAGRKLHGSAALYTSDGELLGNSEAVWIEPKSMPTSFP
jgi:hypothetical protein